MPKRPSAKSRVREPIQVYLESRDRDLLDALAAHASVSRAEILRSGLRRLAAEMLRDKSTGGGIDALLGVLDAAPAVPRDLAARHDDYLYAPKSRKPRASR